MPASAITLTSVGLVATSVSAISANSIGAVAQVNLGTPVLVPAATLGSISQLSGSFTSGGANLATNLVVGSPTNLQVARSYIQDDTSLGAIKVLAVPVANSDLVQLTAVPVQAGPGPSPLFGGGQQAADMLTGMTEAAQQLARRVLDGSCGAADCAVHPVGHGYMLHVWLRGLGGMGHLTGNGSRNSFSNSYGGALLGAAISRAGVTVGAGTGYLRSATGFPDGRAAQNAAVGFVYGRYATGAWRLQGVAGYGGGMIQGSRVPQDTQLGAAGSRPGVLGVVQVQTAYVLHLGKFGVEPQANLTYLHAGQGGFAESGAGIANLTYAATQADSLSGGFAVRLTRQFTMSHWLVAPWVSLGLQQIFSGAARTAAVSDGAFSAHVAGVSPAPLSAILGAGVATKVTAMLTVFAGYFGDVSANQTDYAFNAGMALHF